MYSMYVCMCTLLMLTWCHWDVPFACFTAGTLENLYGLFESMQKDIQHTQKEMQRMDKQMQHLIQRASVCESENDLELSVEAIQNRRHLASLDVNQVIHSFFLNMVTNECESSSHTTALFKSYFWHTLHACTVFGPLNLSIVLYLCYVCKSCMIVSYACRSSTSWR